MADKWKVLTQVETIAPSATGAGFDKVVRVTFKTAAGVVGVVDVPRDGYSADTVRKAVDDHADQLDAVAEL